MAKSGIQIPIYWELEEDNSVMKKIQKDLTLINAAAADKPLKLKVDKKELFGAKKTIDELRTQMELLQYAIQSESKKSVRNKLAQQWRKDKEEVEKLEASVYKYNTAITITRANISQLSERLSSIRAQMETLPVSSSGFAKLGREAQRVTARLETLQYKMKMALTPTGSTESFSIELQHLNAQWAAMSGRQKFLSDGQLTAKASELLAKYKQITAEVQKRGFAMSEYLAKQERAAAAAAAEEAKAAALRAKGASSRRYENAILNSTVKTQRVLNEQLRIYQERLARTVIGTAKYKQLSLAVQQVQGEITALQGKEQATATKAKTDISEINTGLNLTNGYIARLLIRLGLYSGLFAAIGAIRRVREITAEFEMQRVALGGIIQDSYKAQQMFSQIKAAAVKSPFEIKDLVSYTKQLSAYRVETDKLFETTMRLADVSAGLGVDMNRIILAYGQVRAASVLRGQELRQFTEAGIPLVELLAEKFRKLGDEAITTGDVFKKISNREVPFAMVAEIFEDMTEKGGIFYKMQEKQSETLKGQWMNLKDAVSIMYDEIGNTTKVNSAMSYIIALLREAASNWRNIFTDVASLAGAAASFKLVSLAVKKLNVDLKLLTASERQLRVAMRYREEGDLAAYRSARRQAIVYRAAARETNGYRRALIKLRAALMSVNVAQVGLAAIATVIGIIASKFINAAREARRFREELAEIEASSVSRADYSVYNFQKLADKALNSSSIKEQNEALAELNRTYRDILPTLDRAILAKAKETDGYRALTDAIRDNIKMQMYEEQMNKATETYKSKQSSAKGYVNRKLQKRGVSSDEIAAFWDELDAAISRGEDIYTKRIFEIAGSVSESMESAMRSVMLVTRASGKFQDYAQSAIDLENKIAEIENEMSGLGMLGKYTKMIKDLYEEFNKMNEGADYATMRTNVATQIQRIKETISKIAKEEGLDVSMMFQSDNIDFSEVNKIASKGSSFLQKAVKNLEKRYNSIADTDRFSIVIRQKFESIASSVGIAMDKVQNYLKSDEENIGDWVKKVKDGAEEAAASLKASQTLYKEAPIAANKQAVADNQKRADALKKMYEYAKQYTTEKQKGADKELAQLREEVSLLNKVYEKYKEFSKSMSPEKAQAMTAEFFKETIGSLRYGAAFSVADLQKVLKQYQNKVGTSTADRKRFSIEIGAMIGDSSWKDFKQSVENNLKTLSDQISQSETAKNFFNDILSKTGDANIARAMTISVYGEVGDDLADSMIRQIERVFAGTDFESAINRGTKAIDYNKLLAIANAMPGDSAFKDMAMKIANEGIKANAEWLKNLMTTYNKARDLEVRLTEVKRREANNRAEIEKKMSITTDPAERRVYEQTLNASKKKEAEEIAQIELEALKDTELWQKTFRDLDKIGTTTIDALIRMIKKYIATAGKDLDPKQLKELNRELDKLLDKRITISPFESLSKNFQELMVAMKQLSEARKAFTNEDKQVLAKQESLTSQLTSKRASLTSMEEGTEDYVNTVAAINILEVQLDALSGKFNKAAKNEQDFANAQDLVREKSLAVASSLDSMAGLVSSIQQIYKTVVDLVGISEDSDAGQVLSSINEGFTTMVTVLGAVASMITAIIALSYALDASFGWVAGVALAIAGIIAAIKVVTNIRTQRLQNQIEDLQEEVDRLKETFEDLEKVMAKSFGSDYIKAYQQQISLLNAEAQSYYKMAETERAKGKKADQDKVDGYLKSASDAEKKLAEMQGQLAEHFTGTDLTSAARDFAQAWIDAYKSYASVTTAMKEKFNDMVENMITESLAGKLIQTILSPLFEQIDEMAKSGNELTAQEIAIISGQVPAKIEQINAAMTTMMAKLNEAGLNVRANASGLTGISKDIASASEESILGLASGINTQNFYISGIYVSVNQILALLQGGTANAAAKRTATAATGSSDYLSYLPTIAQNTANIALECKEAAAQCKSVAENLNRVIKPKGTTPSYVVMTNV